MSDGEGSWERDGGDSGMVHPGAMGCLSFQCQRFLGRKRVEREEVVS